jgi:hypothetical protein
VNLHLMIDNIYTKKFIEVVNRNFDLNEHTFIIFVYDKIKYVDPDAYKNIRVIKVMSGVRKFNQTDKKFIETHVIADKKIFIHYLDDLFIRLLYRTEKPLYWALWGADFYNYIRIPLFQNFTKQLIGKEKLQESLKGIYNNIKRTIRSSLRRRFISRINYILTWNEGDYNLIKDFYKTNAKMLEFFYPIPINFEDLQEIDCHEISDKFNLKSKFKTIVQIGNSGDPTNNHLEVFHMLGEIKSNDLCVLAILSYGNQEYISNLIDKGKELFGDRFFPVTDYLPPREYSMILSQVDVAIMNHNRQQGVGNLVSLFYLGKKVYINEQTSTFDFLSTHGIEVYPVKQLLKEDNNEITFFGAESIANNRKKIEELFSEERAVGNMRQLFLSNQDENHDIT